MRREHQGTVRLESVSTTMTGLKRESDGGFKCHCGKKFTHPLSLRRHASKCGGEGGEWTPERWTTCGGSVEDGDGGLESVGLSVNEDYGMLVCLRCRAALRKEHTLTHLSSKHGLRRSKDWLESATEAIQLQGCVEILRRLADSDFTLSMPIEGLPVWDGWKCSGCTIYYARRSSSMTEHVRHEHDGQGMGKPNNMIGGANVHPG